jgi:hypothetical protein
VRTLALVVLLAVTVARPAHCQNHGDIVAQVALEHAPDPGVDGAFAFTLRVLARLNERFPAERAGLLEKTAGENIVPYNGTLVSAARICYPDQHAFKLMTDVPNGSPEWADDGFVSLGGYMKGYLAVGAVVPTPNPPSVIVTPPAVDLSGLRAQLEGILVNQQALKQELDEHVRADGDAHASINQNVSDGRAENRTFFGAIADHWKSITMIAGPLVTGLICKNTDACK